MKSIIISLLLFTSYLLAKPNWNYEPEEILVRYIKSGNAKISPSVYESEQFKIRYGEKIDPPKFDFDQDISKFSLYDLRMLKFEIYARKGYLFNDAVIRNYFNSLKWYQPVYWLKNINFRLNPDEESFYQKIKMQEQLEQSKQIINESFDSNNICNKIQFDFTNLEYSNKLFKNGFVVTKSFNSELSYTYAMNRYSKIPSFVTTDLYLQLMHLYFLHVLTTLEEEKFIIIIKDLTKNLYNKSTKDLSNKNKKEIDENAAFSQFYFAVAYELLTGQKLTISKSFEKDRNECMKNIRSANGLINMKLFEDKVDFSLFKPRGNYQRTQALRRYYQTMIWLGTISFILDNNLALNRAIYIANLLNKDKKTFEKYTKLLGILNFLIGKPDNLSIADIKSVLNKDKNDIKKEIMNLHHEKIHPKGILADKRIKINFFPQLYTPDAHIMNEMVNLTLDSTRRAFPRALDVLAVLGNKPAEDVLLNYFNETKKWPNYIDTLNRLKNEFKDYNYFDNSYGYWLFSLNKLFTKDEQYPLVMKKDNWDKKILNSALASYAELKHDAILYAEQPSVAEGDGDDTPFDLPPETSCVGYVEPNISFWNAGIDFITALSNNLRSYNFKDDNLDWCSKKLLDLNTFLLKVSKKELAGQILTNEEYLKISEIGSYFEDLKLLLINPVESEKKPDDDYSPGIMNDDEMAVVADVFTSNNSCLELGVGRADDIFCIVNIAGYDYLTRGSVFSYYEFHQPISNRLTDKQWREMLDNKQEPKREGWYDEIFLYDFRDNINEIKSNPSSFVEYEGK